MTCQALAGECRFEQVRGRAAEQAEKRQHTGSPMPGMDTGLDLNGR